jgi:hypothetical protein
MAVPSVRRSYLPYLDSVEHDLHSGRRASQYRNKARVKYLLAAQTCVVLRRTYPAMAARVTRQARQPLYPHQFTLDFQAHEKEEHCHERLVDPLTKRGENDDGSDPQLEDGVPEPFVGIANGEFAQISAARAAASSIRLPVVSVCRNRRRTSMRRAAGDPRPLILVRWLFRSGTCIVSDSTTTLRT